MIARAGRRDHRGTEMLGKLVATRPPPSASLDQNGFARFELRRILESPQRREAGQRHGGRFSMAEAVGLLGDDRRLDGNLFRVRPFDALIRHPEHRVPDGEVSDARADRTDHTREVAAKDMREPLRL